jgi:hypothetical protein
MNRFLILFICLIILILSGCAVSQGKAIADPQIVAAVIMSGINGEGLEESSGALWIDDEKGLISFMAGLNRTRLGGESPAIPEIDYTQEGILAVWMGKRPTGGYRVELASDKVSIADHAAVVTVKWTEPAKGAVLIQRITGPFLLIKMKRGDYSRIKVMDEKGLIRVETPVNTHP